MANPLSTFSVRALQAALASVSDHIVQPFKVAIVTVELEMGGTLMVPAVEVYYTRKRPTDLRTFMVIVHEYFDENDKLTGGTYVLLNEEQAGKPIRMANYIEVKFTWNPHEDLVSA